MPHFCITQVFQHVDFTFSDFAAAMVLLAVRQRHSRNITKGPSNVERRVSRRGSVFVTPAPEFDENSLVGRRDSALVQNLRNLSKTFGGARQEGKAPADLVCKLPLVVLFSLGL